jgi:hypothetical protein
MFDHHTAEYNLDMIVQSLILLQDHYSGNRCADCILKHLQTIEAYANEGLSLDHAIQYKDFFKDAIELAEKHKELVVGCLDEKGVCLVKSEEDINKMIQEVRMLRKEINMVLYHLAGDLVYDEEKAVSHDFTHEEHEHHHLGEEEEHIEEEAPQYSEEYKEMIMHEHEINAKKHEEELKEAKD